MAETFAEVMTSTACPKDLIQPLSKLAKGAVAGARKAELMEARLDQTTAAKTARKSRKQESSRVLQTGGVLYARNARQMVMDRAHLDWATWDGSSRGIGKKVYFGPNEVF